MRLDRRTWLGGALAGMATAGRVAAAPWLGRPVAAAADADYTPEELRAALRKAVAFFRDSVAIQGGYVYAQSADLALREAEGVTGPSTIWVQPPGTPLVADAMLDAFLATGEALHLDAASRAGQALVRGQLHSGGWTYRAEFDPADRRKFSYRRDLDGRPVPDPTPPAARQATGGWDVWRQRKFEGNLSTLDDDTTQAAARLLVRLDDALGQREPAIHDAARTALAALVGVQYPNGGWATSFDRFPDRSPESPRDVNLRASYPESWSERWTKDFTGCYVTNDNLQVTAIDTCLLAWRVYGEARYREAAVRGGQFLLRAQMPDPQPAWAQQYNAEMQPVWNRAFEPPSISGRESQQILECLNRLALATGERRFLEPAPRALEYLRASRRPDGRLARFYALRTNEPLYFQRRSGGGHELTRSDDRVASGYGYIVDAPLDAIEASWKQAVAALDRIGTGGAAPAALPAPPVDRAAVRAALDAMDSRGAWVEPGRFRHHKLEPPGGIIWSETFAARVRLLAAALAATRAA